MVAQSGSKLGARCHCYRSSVCLQFEASFALPVRFVGALILASLLLIGIGTNSGISETRFSARISTDVSVGKAPLRVRYRLHARTYPPGQIARVEIYPGDGSEPILAHTGKGWINARPSHVYAKPGVYAARMALTTADGRKTIVRTRIRVEPRSPPDPRELLQVDPGKGDAPLEVTFKVGGRTLEFTPRAARISFGDGTAKIVKPGSVVTHTYKAEGIFHAKIEFRGRYQNRAQTNRIIIVHEEPRLRFLTAPETGKAPMQVTVRANVPTGEIRRARVLMGDRQLLGTRDVVGRKQGHATVTLTRPGTYSFHLDVETKAGKRIRRTRTVEVKKAELGNPVDYYAHDGGVVQIVQQGGAFEGIMRAPTAAQAKRGYDIGTVMVRGAFADRSTSFIAPWRPDAAGSPTRRHYEGFATQTAGGKYLYLATKCPPQWADYSFGVDFGNSERPATIDGVVEIKGQMSRIERARKRLDLPPIRGGMVGAVRNVADKIAAVLEQAGEAGKNPDDCVLADAPDRAERAVFTRITEERAQEMAHENLGSVRRFAEVAHDASLAERRDDGSPRNLDPPVGEAPESLDPVLLATGEFYETSVDLSIPAVRDLGWRFQRTYRSQSAEVTTLGRGWVHNYQLALAQAPDGTWVLRDATGARHRFEPLDGAAGIFAAQTGARLKVKSSERALRTKDGMLYRFRPVPSDERRSLLSRIESPRGRALDLEYDLLGRLVSVVDGQGRRAKYVYDEREGFLARVVSPDGQRIELRHDKDGNLTQVSWFAARSEKAVRSIAYGYARWEKGQPEALRGNLVAIAWTSSSRKTARMIEIAYGQEPNSVEFDRVIRQRTGKAEERFGYAWRDEGGARRFVTTLTASGRAREEHVFLPDGRHLQTSYFPSDGSPVTVRSEYDDDGNLSGRVLASGARLEISPGPLPNSKVVSAHPAPTSANANPVRWIVATEPVFGKIRAVYGPFSGPIPSDKAALAELPQRVWRFDYEEGGIPADRLAAVEHDLPAAGDLNGDGTTDGAFGLPVVFVKQDGAEREETRLIWNPDGTLKEKRNPDGTVLAFGYNDDGRLEKVVSLDPSGFRKTVAQYDWDENSRLIGIEAGDSGYHGFERDGLGLIVRATGPDGFDRRYERDPWGRVLRETDEKGRVRATYAFDDFGRLTQRTVYAAEGFGAEEQYEYDVFGNVIRAFDPAGEWNRTLSDLGLVLRERYPNGSWLGFSYDQAGRLVGEQGRNWRHAYEYDGFGRLSAVRRGDGVQLEFERDARGRPVAARIEDSEGSLIEEHPAAKIPREQVSSASGSGQTPAFLISVLARDWIGRPVEFVGRDGATWRVGFDLVGQLQTVERDDKTLLRIRNDPADPRLEISLYGFEPKRFERTDEGLRITDGTGAEREMRFDGYGRLLSERAIVGNRVYTREMSWTAAGRLSASRLGDVVRRFRYANSDPVEERLSIGGQTYRIARRFDEMGRIVERILPSGTRVFFSYPTPDQVEMRVNDKVIALEYEPEGTLAAATMDSAQIRYVAPVPTAPESEFRVYAGRIEQPSLERHWILENGIVTDIRENGRNGKIRRDRLGRVVESRRPEDSKDAHLPYDGSGPRLPEHGVVPWLPLDASGNHLARLDAAGRAIAIGNMILTRDPWGRVESVETPQGTTGYLRDADGAVVRILRDDVPDTDIVHEGGTITGSYRQGKPLVEYLLDPDNLPVAQLRDGKIELIALDYGGTPLAIVNGKGKISHRLRFSLFGETASPGAPGPGLHGMLLDPMTGLYLTPLRAMWARTGLFLSPEPFGPLASPDPYLYASGDPLSFRDPSGTQSLTNFSGRSTDDSFNPVTKFRKGMEKAYRTAADKVEGVGHSMASGQGLETGGDSREANAGRGPDGISEADGRTGTTSQTDFDSELASTRFYARLTEREASRRAARLAFKRNVSAARAILPENVVDQWLKQSSPDSFKLVWDFEPVPWGTPVTGPVTGAPGDPHGLLRAVLEGENRLEGRVGDTLRFIFREQLATPVPVPPPAAQFKDSRIGRPKVPFGPPIGRNVSSPPAPGVKKPPRGLARFGSAFQ